MKKFITLIFLLVGYHTEAQIALDDLALFDVSTNNTLSLGDFSSKKGIVLIFTSNECAFDNYYIDRIKSLVDSYAEKVQFILVNSNQEVEESIEQMKLNYLKRKITIPYLADKEQALLNRLDAKKTPEAFLLSVIAGKFIIFYSGPIDDNPQVASDVRQNYLKDNIELLLTSKRSLDNVRVVGCSIRKK